MANAQMINDNNTNNGKMYIAFELSNKKWKLVFSDGVKRRNITIDARDRDRLELQIKKAKQKFGLPEDTPTYSCYEAGRDGFWIHHYLESLGINNFVVDSASIEVSRRHRRVKTDRVDACKLMDMLIRYVNGEQKLWSVLHVPNSEQEDARRINREIQRLKKERTAHTNRMTSLLILHGIELKVGREFKQQLNNLQKPWNGEKIGPLLKKELLREYDRYELIQKHLKELEEEKKQILSSEDKQAKKVLTLQRLKGIGPISAWVLVHEYFGWREFNNVKQVGAASGLCPTPYASGDSSIEQGISKAGNKRVRKMMIELAWFWVRYQPQSALSQWFQERFGGGGKRTRRIGIVALARKLLIALWKFLEKGMVPEGALLKIT